MPSCRSLAPLVGATLPLLLVAGCAGGGPPPGPDRAGAPEVAAPEGRVEAIPPPTVGYRADMVMVVDGERYVGRVYAAPGVRRMELPTGGKQAVVTVVREDPGSEALTWLERTEIGGETALAEMAQGHVGLDLRTSERLAFDLEEIGPDRLDDGGPETTKYAYRALELDGAVREGVLWLTPENILVRFAGTEVEPGRKPQAQLMQLENVEIGPQDPALFEVPGVLTDPVPGFFEDVAGEVTELFRTLFRV